MKRAWLTIVLAVAAIGATSVFGALPEGTHRGDGSWKGRDGKSGKYRVEMVIKDNFVASVYRYGKTEEKFTFQADFQPNGFFNVLMDKHSVGEGFCGDHQCHYRIQVGSFQLEETLTFWNGKVYRLGAKGENGRQVHWQETLESK